MIGAAAVLLDAQVPRAERVGSVAAHRRPLRRADAAADRHHLGRRALVGHAADGAHRGVDPASQVRPAGGAAAGGRRRASSARWPPRSPDWPGRWPGRGCRPPRRRGCGSSARACGRRSGSSSSSRSGSASGRSSSCPIASRSATCTRAAPSWRCGRPAAWSTALEPIMLACGGVWVAHGSGSADREVGRARRAAARRRPAYTLRRVWLTEQEEAGYYYGFANEGLWPLCHIVHERPQFRADDWEQYRAVNAQLCRRRRSRRWRRPSGPSCWCRTITSRCCRSSSSSARPTRASRSSGTSRGRTSRPSASARGRRRSCSACSAPTWSAFHTQFHCNNFLETVERTIEGRIDWENFTVVARPAHDVGAAVPHQRGAGRRRDPAPDSREPCGPSWASPPSGSGIGVERVDYTKGLPERIRALRRFFERWPEYRRRVVFVQIASPSRTRIPRYQALQQEVRETVRTINEELGERGWRPDRLSRAPPRPRRDPPLLPGRRLLHGDVAARRHEPGGQGVRGRPGRRRGRLILSRFTGASRELRDAWLVNPYDVEDMAERACTRPHRRCARAPLAHGAHAGAGARAQHLRLGRPAHGRAGEDSPASLRPPRLSVVELTDVKIAPAVEPVQIP